MPVILEPENFYHILNHANGNENLFNNTDDYNFFLKQYLKYIEAIADTYAYCLMPNHFHFLLRIKKEIEVKKLFELQSLSGHKATDRIMETQTPSVAKGTDGGWSIKKSNHNLLSPNSEWHNKKPKPSNQFSHLFNSYTQTFNNKYKRKGSLFYRPFRRELVTDKNYLLKLIHYIHYNPVKHGFSKVVADWNFSSYNAIISKSNTLIKRTEVIRLFDDLENFKYCHTYPPDLTGIE